MHKTITARCKEIFAAAVEGVRSSTEKKSHYLNLDAIPRILTTKDQGCVVKAFRFGAKITKISVMRTQAIL